MSHLVIDDVDCILRDQIQEESVYNEERDEVEDEKGDEWKDEEGITCSISQTFTARLPSNGRTGNHSPSLLSSLLPL